MSASRKMGSKILGVISRADAERLLLDLANSGDGEKDCFRLRRHHPKPLGPLDDREILTLRDRLRQAWDAPNLRARDWYLFQLRRHWFLFQLRKSLGPEPVASVSNQFYAHYLDEPPPITSIEVAAFHLQSRIGDRAKHCCGPDCLAPYFIAAKRWQKYCTPKCAGPALRDQKRKWWHEHKDRR